MKRVAFQGELGAFSEEAVHQLFPGTEPVPRRTFAEVGEAVASGVVDLGLLPIENSLAGSVVGSYDVLATGALAVVGEVVTPIHHCVMGIPGASLDGLTHILSHPVALAQCQLFLQGRRGVEAIAFYDTAGAAKEISQREPGRQAAIAGRPAAERYGLDILAADIEDRHDNQTRFLVVSRPENAESVVPAAAARGDTRKTALLVETKNVPGALVRILLPFAERGYNLTKIESRPGVVPWSYRFFIEVEADTSDAELGKAIEEAREFASLFRVLGSFPRWAGE
jgi:prephenate dehydratase